MRANEETLRGQVVLPYLTALGFSLSDIELEYPLSIRLGRSTVKLRDFAKTGFADILVRGPERESLLLLELKRPGLALTDDDRDQGISYARLLEHIPPFVLVSNGTESRIYDTITREQLEAATLATKSKFFANGGALATTDDIRVRWEAMQFFVGASSENVQRFSRAQVARHLEPLAGDARNGNFKYLRDMYVARPSVRRAIDEFMSSEDIAFVLVGDSGVGKTNELCALAEDLCKSHIVLFYSGYALSQAPGEALRNEFNWGFSQHWSEQAAFKRLASLADVVRSPIIVIIDGLDEAPVDKLPQSISTLVGHFGGMDGRIRFITSVKSSEWPRFAQIRGNPSELALALQRDEHGQPMPFTVSEWNDAERDVAVGKYTSAYELPSEPMSQLRESCRNPFFLRVVCETFAGRSEPLPDRLTGNDLARKWLDRKLALMTDPKQARRDLDMVARTLNAHARLRSSKQLTVGALESIPEADLPEFPSDELVSHGVLSRIVDQEGRANYRFIHGQILAYVIAHHVLRLDTVTVEEFQTLLPQLLDNHISQGALAWHLRDCSAAHHRAVSAFVRGRALLFGTSYSEILDAATPALRDQVAPHVAGDVGVAYALDKFGIGPQGLYPIGRVTALAVTELPGDLAKSWDPLPFFELGCSKVWASSKNFGSHDPVEVAAELAHKEVEAVLKEGRLDEDVDDNLDREVMLVLVSVHRRRLGKPFDDHRPISNHLPLRPLDVRNRLQIHLGKDYLLKEYLDKETERIRSESSESAGIHITIPPAIYQDCSARAFEEVARGRTFPIPNSKLKRELSVLNTVLERLIERDVKQVEGGAVALPRVGVTSFGPSPIASYSDLELKQLLTSFFMAGVNFYRLLVERNFPGLRNAMALYRRLPCKVVASYSRQSGAASDRNWGRLVWGLRPATSSEAPEAMVYIDPSKPIFNRRDNTVGAPWVCPEGRIIERFSVMDLSQILLPSGAPDFGTYSEASRYAPARAFAYRCIIEDFKDVTLDDFLRTREKLLGSVGPTP